MGLAEMLDLIAAYYQKATTQKMTYERRLLCTKILQSGLRVKDIMDAIDTAAVRYGMEAVERDYWETIHKECRATYRRLRKQGILEKAAL